MILTSSGRTEMTKYQRGKKGLTSPCKACRRRVRPELLDGSYLCAVCRGDAAAVWLAEAERKTRRGRRKQP